MVRLDDGMRGRVEKVEVLGSAGLEELRVVYIDRGERRVAGKREKWLEVERLPGKLLSEEIRLVALAADQQLRAIDRHEPFRWWEHSSQTVSAPHDEGLVEVISHYLARRK